MPFKTYKSKYVYKETHKCKLNKLDVEDELPSYPPYASKFIKKLYVFTKSWTVVSHKHPQAREYFRSEYALLQEKRRQLEKVDYRIIIHPFSRFAMIHKIVIFFLWLIAFFIDPFFGAFLSDFIIEQDRYDDKIQLCMTFFFLIHFTLQFFLGVQLSGTKEIVLDHRRIVVHYLKTYFIFDLIPILYQLVYHASKPFSFHINVATIPLYFLRFVRLITMIQYFLDISSFYKVPESTSRCMAICFVQIIIIHWWTCIFVIVSNIRYYLDLPDHKSWVIKKSVGTNRQTLSFYLESLLSVACHYLGAGKGNMETQNPTEELILAMILMCGFTVQIYIIAIILLIFGTINISESKYEELIVQLNDYMVSKRLPSSLKKRLHVYYEYRFQKQFFHENMILSVLSEHLRCEVVLYSCKNLIQRMKLLRDASKEVIGAIVNLLKQEIFLPDDVIIKADIFNENIYFISFGTIALYLENGLEITHLEDGHHFGELVLASEIEDTERLTPTAVAVEVTEVFYLDKKDFLYIASLDPDLAFRIEQSVSDKLAKYQKILQQSVENFDSSDILEQLRRGRILERKRKRIKIVPF